MFMEVGYGLFLQIGKEFISIHTYVKKHGTFQGKLYSFFS